MYGIIYSGTLYSRGAKFKPSFEIMDKAEYWLKEDGELWKNVTQSEFTHAERRAGFRPKVGCGPVATSSFSKGRVEGRTTYPETNPSAYADWDPAFARILEAHQAVAA